MTMRRTHRFMPLLTLICCLSLLLANQAMAQQCGESTRTSGDAKVYDRKPNFSTAKGWVYGSIVTTLPADVPIYICKRVKVRFGFSSQKWSQIAYYKNKKWLRGWVRDQDIVASVSPRSLPSKQTEVFYGSLVLAVNSAFAQTGENSDDSRSDYEPPEGEMPPGIDAGQEASTEDEAGSGGLISFYITLFIVMLLGMIAKAAFDFLNSEVGSSIREQLRKMSSSLLVSPVIFLAFMQTADFALEGIKAFVVISCLAFQNGFFWQTVFSTKDVSQSTA